MQFAVTPAQTPWCQLSAGLDAGAGLVVPILDLDYSNPSIFSHTFQLAQCNGPLPSGSITVVQQVVGPAPSGDWAFGGDLGHFALPAVGGSKVFQRLIAGNYTLTETPQSGYALSTSCSNGATGTNSVTVTLATGQSVRCTVTASAASTSPNVTGVSPSSGATTGGTSVNVTGINFTGATAVVFGSSPASSFIVNSDTSITAVSPAQAAGAVDVRVMTPAGASPLNRPADQFAYSSHLGALVLTGHDMDFHCAGGDPNECAYLQIALALVRNGSTLPVPALDQGSEVSSSITNAFGAGVVAVTAVDPTAAEFTTLPLVDSGGHPLYSAIVTASDTTCGGCDDTPAGESAINARAADIASFVGAGGGVLALAGADNLATYYNFLPVSSVGAPVTYPFTVTSFGSTPGITNDEANCCATHNSFQLPTSGSPLQIAETDGAGLAETLIDLGGASSAAVTRRLTPPPGSTTQPSAATTPSSTQQSRHRQ